MEILRASRTTAGSRCSMTISTLSNGLAWTARWGFGCTASTRCAPKSSPHAHTYLVTGVLGSRSEWLTVRRRVARRHVPRRRGTPLGSRCWASARCTVHPRWRARRHPGRGRGTHTSSVAFAGVELDNARHDPAARRRTRPNPSAPGSCIRQALQRATRRSRTPPTLLEDGRSAVLPLPPRTRYCTLDEALRHLQPAAGGRRGRRPAEAADPGEVVVDVARAGICGTDVEFYTGEMQYLHGGNARTRCASATSGWAPSSAVGDGVDGAWLGPRVTGDTMLGCGDVPPVAGPATITSAIPRRARHPRRPPGALAEQLAVPGPLPARAPRRRSTTPPAPSSSPAATPCARSRRASLRRATAR